MFSPNVGKYRPEKSPNTDSFQAVLTSDVTSKNESLSVYVMFFEIGISDHGKLIYLMLKTIAEVKEK